MCFHTDCHVTDSGALHRISWEAGQSVDTSPEMIHCEILIPVQAERRDWNFACVACVCIQDKQKTLLRLTCQRSPSVSSDPTSLCITQPPPPFPFALVPTPVCCECTPTNAEFKNRNSSDSDSVSSFKDKQRRKTSLSLSDQGRQDGKQRETAETQSVCFKPDECVISAVVRWFPAHTLHLLHVRSEHA